jgi:hypothetical protein
LAHYGRDPVHRESTGAAGTGWHFRKTAFKSERNMMKLGSPLAALAMAVGLIFTTSAFAAQSCCVKAKAEGKECKHQCCIDAHKAKKLCEKCQKDATCCDKAIAEGKDCPHKCCADATKEKKICEKCNPKEDRKK